MLEQSTEKQGIFDRRIGRLSFFLWNFVGGVVIQILGYFMDLFDRPGMPPMGSGTALFFYDPCSRHPLFSRFGHDSAA